MPYSTSQYDYDVIVIGAGPAGYVAAIRFAQLGFKTASVDNWSDPGGTHRLGGTYVNAGCVACVALLESAKIHHLLKHELHHHGMNITGLSVDLAQMMARKQAITHQLSQQIEDLFKANAITPIHAKGRLLNAKQVEISPFDHSPKTTLSAKYIILATGSSPIQPSRAVIDNEYIISSTRALTLQSIPQTLGILGGGIIGLELAGIWHKMGAKVTLLEAQNSFLHSLDQDIAGNAYTIYLEQGLDIRLGARVISAQTTGPQVTVEYQDHQRLHTLSFDKLIIASGRKPNSENLAAAEAQLLLDENGFVHVDENCKTNLPGVYAIGDLSLLGPMLAHKGVEEGIFIAEHIAGQATPINYNTIPHVVYTDPEIAWVGQTEQNLKAIGENYKTAIFPLHANAKALATNKAKGMIKLISHAGTDKILGVHIIDTHASELIAEAVLAMEFSASAEDLARTIHAYPSLSEAIHEAALALSNRALHLPPLQQ